MARPSSFPNEHAILFAIEWLRSYQDPATDNKPPPELIWVAEWLEEEMTRRSFERAARRMAKKAGVKPAIARRYLRDKYQKGTP